MKHKKKHKISHKEEERLEEKIHPGIHKEIKKKHKKDPKKKHHSKHDEAVSKAMKHKDVLGAGAKKRKKLGGKAKVEVVMKEFKRGTLHSGSGAKVSNPKQAIAIGLSEARKAGAHIPKPKKKKK